MTQKDFSKPWAQDPTSETDAIILICMYVDLYGACGRRDESPEMFRKRHGVVTVAKLREF